MKTIKITDNFEEAAAIGKSIFDEKKNVYTDEMIQSIYTIIDLNIPNASTEERENLFYHSVYDYWVYGATIGEEFYFNFYKISDQEKRSYITTREKVLYIRKLNKKEDAYILNNKYETYKRFKDYYKRDMIVLNDESDYDAFSEFVDKHKTFVVKPSELGLGIGVHKETIKSEEEKQIKFKQILNEGKCHAEESKRTENAAVVLEEVIKQADSLARIHEASVNGVRVTTLMANGNIHIIHPWIKMGVNGDFVTSAFLGSIDACIDAKTGIVDTVGIGEFGQRELYHPNSGIQIKGFQIPRWDELIELAKELSGKLPTIPYIGWDFALTDEGWVIMEGNFTGDFMWQLFYGKGMKKEFEDLSGVKLNKQFWWE